MRKRRSSQFVLPAAIMFDLDGTLVISTIDFMKFRKQLLAFIARKGADMSHYSIRQTTVSMIAKFEAEMLKKRVAKKLIDSYLDDIEHFLNKIELERIDDTVPAKGAEALLKKLKDRKVKIGILTRGSPEYALKALSISGLTDYIDAIIARDRKSGIRPKPDPESAFALAKELGVKPADTIIVGDYSIDYLCARDAEIKFYGIASDSESRKSLKEAGCENILTDLDKLREVIGL